MDAVGLYLNISHDGELIAMQQKALDSWQDKTVSTDSPIDFLNIFEHSTPFYIQLRETAIGTKIAPSHEILFMGNLEEKILEDCDEKILVW